MLICFDSSIKNSTVKKLDSFGQQKKRKRSATGDQENQLGPRNRSLDRNKLPDANCASIDGLSDDTSPPLSSYGGIPSSFDPLVDPLLDSLV